MGEILRSPNYGYAFPDPGKYEKAFCGVCGAEMNVQRGVVGPSGFAEASGGLKHLHDRFLCPHLETDWHKKAKKVRQNS